MNYLYCDTETYCEVPITHGTHAYAEQAEVMLFAYAFGDGVTKVWDMANKHLYTKHRAKVPQYNMPIDLENALNDPNTMTVWHNSGFDRTVLRHAMGINLPIERVHDTMVQALAHGLPGGLDKLSEILKLAPDKAKLKIGRQLILRFCKPQRGKRNDSKSHPEEWQQFIEYATQDIEAMRVIHQKMPMWNYKGLERKLWELDQKINDRGFAVDVNLAQAAIKTIEREQKKLARQTVKLTEGDVEKATQRDALLTHILLEHGVYLPDLTGATIERRLSDPDIPEGVKELLRIRQQASTTSTSKYKTLVKAVSSDGRLRGTLQFCGANRTGRWAGRLFQPQNLPRPKLKQDEIDQAILDIKADVADLVYDNVMEAVSASVRGAIKAPKGKKLVVSDLSNIEGRMAAWLAGEDWKIQSFKDYDNGTGHDLYKLAYAKSFGVAPDDVDKDQRQIGKVQELALQYEGGVGAFTTFAAVYNIDLDSMATDALPKVPQHIRSEANSFWGFANKNRRTLGLPEHTFVACDSLKRMWREAHPAITSYWSELQDGVLRAINSPGNTIRCRRLRIIKSGAWLRIVLPSGRSLCYASPKIIDDKISYLGVNQYSRKWERINTYGGKLFENVTQGTSRDVMAYNMPGIEAAGYQIILSVHDELPTETEDTPDFNEQELSRLLAAPPPWGVDIPLAAGGFEAKNYRKD